MSEISFRMIAVYVLVTVKFVNGGLGSYTPFNQHGAKYNDFEVIHPVRLDSKGNFMSHNLHFLTQKNHRKKRDIEEHSHSYNNNRLFYSLPFKGKQITLNLTENEFLVPDNFLIERFENHNSVKQSFVSSFSPGTKWPCHFRGHVAGHPESKVALSTCHGLTGFISTADGDFLLEPMEAKSDNSDERSQPHKIYRQDISTFSNKAEPMLHKNKFKRPKSNFAQQDKSASPTQEEESPFFSNNLSKDYCGVLDSKRRYRHIVKRRERWESRNGFSRRFRSRKNPSTSKRRSKRSVSMERLIEMLVVADKTMVNFYDANDHGGVEKYVLTIVNMVSELFKDASIGNSLQVSLVRLILLEDEKDGPEITSHAEDTLERFCRWAKKINPKGDDHPNHHDVAVLLTRRDICSESNTSCETLGLAHVAGMCQSRRSCSLNQDTGLSVAYTVAHELGHNFAMHHDGQMNDCKPSSKYNHLMAPHLTSSKLAMKWSSCSRRYITRFLDRNWGYCLNDKPSLHPEYPAQDALPGVVYDADHQCRLMFGEKSRYCPGITDMCHRLWCRVGGTCRSRHHAAATGTKCERRKWCLGGKCVSMRKHPKKVDGGWGEWSKWTLCSRTCGIGVKSSSRHCDDPLPRNGGHFCVGERKRYKTCSVWRCPVNMTDDSSFRAQQCADVNHVRYRNRTLKWLPVESTLYPCELHCYTRSGDQYFADRLKSKVIDGTKCFTGSDDICVDGICRRLGCDKNVGSRALEDHCGVCHGDGSACYQVDTIFSRRKGEEYTIAHVVPVGARNLEVIEMKAVHNFLALRDPTNTSHYYLNGNYMIQWDTKFQLAGTQFTYKRINETRDMIRAPGPLTENVTLMVLFVEANPGVSIKYTMPYDLSFDPNPELDLPVFSWTVEGWSECSQECGGGSQYLRITCHERVTGVVEDFHCNAAQRPTNGKRKCNELPCPVRWAASPWGACSMTCGNKRGFQRRSITCVRSVTNGEVQDLEAAECESADRPNVQRKCHSKIRAPCPIWRTGKWQQCSQTCGTSFHNRTVQCITFIEEDVINLEEEEIVIEKIEVSDLEMMGKDTRRFAHSKRSAEMKPIDFDPDVDGYEVDYSFCDTRSKPKTRKNCHLEPCSTTSHFTTAMSTRTKENRSSIIPTATYGDPSPGEINVDPENHSSSALTEERNLTHQARYVSEAPTVFSQNGRDMKNKISTEGHIDTVTEPDDHRDAGTREIVTPVSPVSPSQSSSHVDVAPTGETGTASETLVPSKDEAVSTDVVMTSETSVISLEDIVMPDISTQAYSMSTTSKDEAVSTDVIMTSEISVISLEDRVIPDTSTQAHSISTRKDVAPPSDWSTTSKQSNSTPAESMNTSSNHLSISSHQLSNDQPSFNHGLQTRSSSAPDEFDINDKSGDVSSDPVTDDFVAPDVVDVVEDFDVAGGVTTRLVDETSAIPFKHKQEDEEFPSEHGEWISGDWGECSVTCGVGAQIRPVRCSLSDEKLCNMSAKPAPAVICRLGPCAKWAYGEWSQCSTECGSGIRTLQMECIDEWTEKVLSLQHCSKLQKLPPVNISCHQSKCLSWRTSRWNSCSAPCGTGIQRRRVACSRVGQCDLSTKPVSEKSCLSRICVDWKALSWNKCSVHCGGGIRRRDVICVERKTGILTNSTLCQPGLKPNRYERCNQGQCPVTDYDFGNCHADRLSPGFCGLLQKLGRCVQPSLAIQCCVTCKTYLSVRLKDKIS